MARLYSRNYRASKTFEEYLTREVERRFQAREARELQCKTGKADPHPLPEPENDGLQWLIDTAPKKQQWSTGRLVGEIMAIWYGSVHTLTIVRRPSSLHLSLLFRQTALSSHAV